MFETACRSGRPGLTSMRAPGVSPGRKSCLFVRANSEQHARQVPLQGGNAFWLLDPLQDRYFNVHGRDFIIQRPETFAKIFPKLRLRKLHQRHYDIQTVSKHDGGTAMVRSSHDLPHDAVLYEGRPVIDITQLLEEVVEEQHAPELATGMVPSTGMVACSVQPQGPASGLIYVPQQGSEQDGEQEVYIGSSSSPRRTKVIGFTCLRCNARSYKPINPVSFEEGTLVVQCGKCERWHKIRDHLHLFHDMAGELFMKASPILEEDVPEALRMPLQPFYWHDDQEGDASNN